MGAALGAKLAFPDRTVLNIAGDGCFRMNLNELITAVRYDIPAGCAAAYFPEATPLLAASNLSLHTRTPAYKDIPVLVRAADGAP